MSTYFVQTREVVDVVKHRVQPRPGSPRYRNVPVLAMRFIDTGKAYPYRSAKRGGK